MTTPPPSAFPGESLSARAYSHIIRVILNRELLPGAALQEAALADWLGMSRTPVREAIKRIEAQGLAQKSGRFLRVRRLAAPEVREIFTLREALEGFAARQATGLPSAALSDMRGRVQDLMKAGDSELQHQVDSDFHDMIAEASGNTTLARTVAKLRLRTCMFDIHQVPDRFLQGCAEHLAILDALSARDAETAGALMTQHVRHARDAVLGRLEQLSGEQAE